MFKWIKLIRFVKKNRKAGAHKFTIQSTDSKLYIYALDFTKEAIDTTEINY